MSFDELHNLYMNQPNMKSYSISTKQRCKNCQGVNGKLDVYTLSELEFNMLYRDGAVNRMGSTSDEMKFCDNCDTYTMHEFLAIYANELKPNNP